MDVSRQWRWSRGGTALVSHRRNRRYGQARTRARKCRGHSAGGLCAPDLPAPPPARTAVEIEDWLVAYLATELETSPDQMDVTVPFDRFGLSSATAVFMIGNLEEWLGQEVDPTLPYDYPTIQALARRLAGQPG